MKPINYYGHESKKYTPLTLIVKGGEGEIFTVQEDPSLVIKIYKGAYLENQNLVNAERRDKLTYMIKNPPRGEQFDQIAWPLDVLSDSNGIFVGFVMKKIKNVKPLSEILHQYPSHNQECPWCKTEKINKNTSEKLTFKL
jgi:DNA-binding helix-hairpin-helix protein with protein kinase domain